MEIIIKEKDNKCFAIATKNNDRDSVMTYSISCRDFIIKGHTEVEPKFEGLGKQ